MRTRARRTVAALGNQGAAGKRRGSAGVAAQDAQGDAGREVEKKNPHLVKAINQASSTA